MFVLKSDLEEEQINSLVERFSQVIATQGGTVENVDRWGKRRLAYEVEGFHEGYYVIIRFQGGPAVASELDRTFRITDSVLRQVILRADNIGPRVPERRDEPKLPEPKMPELKAREPKLPEPRVQGTRTQEPKVQETRMPEPEIQAAQVQEPKVQEPEIQEPTVEEPK
jgi:small subunit ribosomal protein S6